jgi:hypothetical protein
MARREPGCLRPHTRLIDAPSGATPTGRSPESVLSDFNGLRRHSRVLPTPRPLEPSGSGLRRRRTSPPRFWRRSRLFKGLGAKTCHKNRSRRLTLKSRSRVPYGKREPLLSEKQYHISAGLARNCRFFLTPVAALDRAFRPCGTIGRLGAGGISRVVSRSAQILVQGRMSGACRRRPHRSIAVLFRAEGISSSITSGTV